MPGVTIDDATLARALDDAVGAALARDLPRRATIAVALSGGRDSVTLLAALLAATRERGHPLCALHVEHGLSPHAARWQAFCADLCARLGVPFHAAQVRVTRGGGESLEALARRERYAALAGLATEAGASHVALAHHRDDQAETFLLQLLRGAGPRGLAAMPAVRTGAHGSPVWWRPLLGIERASIDAYLRIHRLTHVEDESNASSRHRRNAIRLGVMPVLAALAPAAPAAIARAAAHQADAVRLGDDLARIDAAARANDRPAIDAPATGGATLACGALRALAPHRARNLLRFFLREQGLAAPSTARLDEMLDQFTGTTPLARVEIRHDGLVLGLHRDRIHVHAPAPPPYELPWQGEAALDLPHGVLSFTRAPDGLDVTRITGPVMVRSRRGGERFRLAANRPRRSLKATLHEAGWPQWERRDVPLVVAGSDVVAVPGLGIDPAYAACPGCGGVAIGWLPAPLRTGHR